MPTKRTRTRRSPVSEFSPELIAWIRGEGPHPIDAYFLSQDEYDRLTAQHGVEGVRPRGPGYRDD